MSSSALSIVDVSPVDAADPRVVFAVRLSLCANLALFGAKLFAFIVSGSQSILASLADSGVDLASQFVVFLCDNRTRKVDRNYPVGKARLETVGALIIACIMTFAAVLVIQSSIEDLTEGIGSGKAIPLSQCLLDCLQCGVDDPPVPEMNVGVYVIVVLAILLKAGLFVVCSLLRDVSDSALVLAQDHKNDVLSNTVAVIAAAIATSFNEKSATAHF